MKEASEGTPFNFDAQEMVRFAHASSSSMAELVDVKLTGIPEHAWCRSTAKHLLRDSCWVDELHLDTMEKRPFHPLW
jgi:hypothetical protein